MVRTLASHREDKLCAPYDFFTRFQGDGVRELPAFPPDFRLRAYRPSDSDNAFSALPVAKEVFEKRPR